MGTSAVNSYSALTHLTSDSAEAAIALRQRLNETVDQLDVLRKEHTELEVKFQTQSKELTIAKSDREFVPHIESLPWLTNERHSEPRT